LKPLAIPKQEQIEALIDGSIHRLVQEHGGPKFANLTALLDVTRSDLEDFFRENHGRAEEYFQRLRQPSADGLRLDRVGGKYRVVTLTNSGSAVFPHVFDNINEAVAAYVAWFYSIIDDVSK
jgi:hypothetical protein